MPLASKHLEPLIAHSLTKVKPRAPNARAFYFTFRSTTITKLQTQHFYLLIMTAPLYMTENVGILRRFLRIQRRVPYAHSSRDQRLAEVLYSASHMIHCCSPLIPLILNNTNFAHRLNLMQQGHKNGGQLFCIYRHILCHFCMRLTC